MAEGEGDAAGRENPVLRFFGLHTAAEASDTALWVAPYLGVFLCGLIALSLLVQRFLPLPLWVHLLALGLAGVNCFLFLAHIRQMVLGEAEVEVEVDADAEPPPDEG
jgi:hypothetical protein